MGLKPSLDDVIQAMRQSWSADTSADSDWSSVNPALGQCSVSSCVVQDYCGGEILNRVVTFPSGATGSHYVNMIDGKIVDTTLDQFPPGTTMAEARPKPGKYATTREYCLSFSDTRRRYELLKQRVDKQLGRRQAISKL